MQNIIILLQITTADWKTTDPQWGQMFIEKMWYGPDLEEVTCL